MLNSLLRVLCICCVITALFTSTVHAQLRAGAAKVDITPTKWPVEMVGTFSQRLATRAWDPLYARALMLADKSTRITIVTVDSCYVPTHVFDDAKRRISRQTGMLRSTIMMSATHTHTAPAARDRREVIADPEYVEQLTEGIVKAVIIAQNRMERAEIGWAVVSVPKHLHNRRWFMKPGGIVANPFGGTDDQVRMNPPPGSDLLEKPAGPTDPDLTILYFRSRTKQNIAMLANYSLHYVGGIATGGVSADYFGEFARLIEEASDNSRYRHPMVAMLSNGASGDVNNIDFEKPRPRKAPFVQMRIVAQDIAAHAVQAVQSMEFHKEVPLAMVERRIKIPKRRPSPAQVARAEEVMAAEDETSFPKRAKAYAKWVLELNEPPHQSEVVLQAIRIGDVGIAAIPCEVFAEIGLEIKRISPLKHTFTTSLANGHHGYLPTPEQHRLGGYETWLGSNTLEEQASVKIVDVLRELLTKVDSD